MAHWTNKLLNPQERLLLRAGLSAAGGASHGVKGAIGGVFSAWSTHVLLTTQRIMVVSGLLSRDIVDRPLNEVVSVQMQRSVWGRMLGYGTLSVHFGRIGLEPLMLSDVQDPETMRVAISHAANVVQRRR